MVRNLSPVEWKSSTSAEQSRKKCPTTGLLVTDMLNEYDAVIRDQLSQGVVEKTPELVTGREFYIPHRAVVKEEAESTKLRVVYDASARQHDNAPSLNECLPPLQNQLWNVIVRNRFHPVAIAGDLQKAFLQLRVREAERDALRFHWISGLQSPHVVETYRFTRVVFGLTPYLISGGSTTEEAKQLKEDAVEIFGEAKFNLHKWHSNVPELETVGDNGEPSYAKQQLGVPSTIGECKILGLKWDKVNDALQVVFPSEPATLNTRLPDLLSAWSCVASTVDRETNLP